MSDAILPLLQSASSTAKFLLQGERGTPYERYLQQIIDDLDNVAAIQGLRIEDDATELHK